MLSEGFDKFQSPTMSWFKTVVVIKKIKTKALTGGKSDWLHRRVIRYVSVAPFCLI